MLGNGHALVLRGARHSNVPGLPVQSSCEVVAADASPFDRPEPQCGPERLLSIAAVSDTLRSGRRRQWCKPPTRRLLTVHGASQREGVCTVALRSECGGDSIRRGRGAALARRSASANDWSR